MVAFGKDLSTEHRADTPRRVWRSTRYCGGGTAHSPRRRKMAVLLLQRSLVGPGRAGDDGDQLHRTARVFARHGYEPRMPDREISRANYLFDRLAIEHAELVCDKNLAVIGGVIDGVGIQTLTAGLAPQPGSCCVGVGSRSASS
jgi:hypothetical protein